MIGWFDCALLCYVTPKEGRFFSSRRPTRTVAVATLEMRCLLAYIPDMDAAVNKTPPDWMVESLERSEAQIAAGQAVPLEPVLDRLRASIARMKAAQAQTELARRDFPQFIEGAKL